MKKYVILAGLLMISFSAMPVWAIGSEDDGGQYIGPEGCKYCHEVNYDEWIQTDHARAFQRLVDNGQQENPECLPCHTTGYNGKTYRSKDITCEACHGSGDISNNIARQVVEIISRSGNMSQSELNRVMEAMDKQSMVMDLSAEMCGRCHSQAQYPTYDEWVVSRHARSLDDLKASGIARDECLECHAAEYITAGEHDKPGLEEVTYGLTCVGCHDVHDTETDMMLRKPKDQLCESCHTMQGATPGESVHSSQSEIRRSHGGVDADTFIYQPNAGCADCHRYTRPYSSGVYAITGHSFEINFNVCMKCHEGFATADDAKAYVEQVQADTLLRLTGTKANVDQAGVVTSHVAGSQAGLYNHVYQEAVFNLDMVEADGSLGAHNPKYVAELLDKADFKAKNIIDQRPNAKSPGFGIFTGLIMVILGVRYRKGR